MRLAATMRWSVPCLVAAIALATGCSGSSFAGSTGGAGSGGAGGSGNGGSSGSSGSGGIGADGGAGTSGSGGVGGSGGAAGGDAGKCDTSKAPSQEQCLVDDQYAVFVDGTAASGGDGSKASPFNKIGDAIAAAGAKMILVCDTTYDEQVKLTGGVHLYGGFKCSDWSYETGKRAIVKPTAEGYALEIDSVTDPIVIEDMEFDSQDATAAGGNSVAAFVHASSNVALHRDKLVAGKGKAGAVGVLTKFTYPTQTDLDGNSANLLAGGALKQCSCPAGDQSLGGRGGDGPTPQDGNPGLPDLGAGQAGKAGQSCTGNPPGGGSDGNPASAASPASGATTSGTLDAGGWTPANGSNGKAGGPGQGGGGGASTATGGGGGGGCGGCGGSGGHGGGGGGASIALMVLDSTVSVDAGSELVASDAGAGGKGAAGQAGQSIFGFHGNGSASACGGGNGGAGGAGGAGGGGAGGISVAVLWKGSAAPTIDSGATMTFGAKGAAGQGGKAGANDGIDGVAQNELEVK